jgi:hypothetical protein
MIKNVAFVVAASLLAAGCSGKTGATGAAGARGANGANGAVGTAGANGTDGANGATGSTGATGPTGPAGSTGPMGGPQYVRTIVVSPVPGEPLASGAALRNVFPIAGASPANPYLVHLEPGDYDLSHATLTLPDGVDLEGSGEDTTTVHDGTITLADAEVRFLTLQAAGTTTGISCNDKAPRLTHVTLGVSGGAGSNQPMIGFVDCQSTLTNVTLTVLDGATDLAMSALAIEGGTTVAEGLTVDANLQVGNSEALYIGHSGFSNQLATVTLRNATIAVNGNSAVGVAALKIVGGNVTIDGSTVSLAGGTPDPTGLRYAIQSADPYNDATTLTITRSTVTATTGAIGCDGPLGTSVDIADSQVDGAMADASFGAATWRCVDDYDGSFAPIAAACK